jgi:predicted nucleic acid-binding protein
VKVVFADTGYWEAVLNPRDELHQKAIQVSSALGKCRQITTEMVLDELLAALRKEPVRSYAIRGVQTIRQNPNVEVVPQTALQFERAFDLYRRMNDKEWSLTDCASFDLRLCPAAWCTSDRMITWSPAGGSTFRPRSPAA